MKKTILLGISAIATMLSSCSDDWGVNKAGSGYISPVVGIDTETVVSRSADSETATVGSRAAEVTAADLSLRLTSADGSNSWEWPTVADFPADKEFAIGEYTLEAFYGDVNEEGFDCPAYFGSQNLLVADGQTTKLGLTASMAKSMVTIKYTDAFTGYMADWNASVNGIAYAKEEARPVYVKPGDVSIKISVTKPNGLTASFALDNVSTKARYHYTVTVDVNNGNVGDAELKVTFDDNMDTEDVVIDLSDKLLSAPAPIVTPEGFEPETPVEVVEGIVSDKKMSMTLVARAGLKGVTLATSSATLIKQGWPEQIDLMAADDAQKALLTSLGLDVLGLWKTPGEMAVVDFSGVTKNLKTVAGDNNVTTFTLTVKDKLMRESEAATLTINTEEAVLELAKAGDFYEPGATLDVKLGFNGGSVKENVTIEYKNPIANVWRALEIVKVSEAVSRSMYDYTVTIATPEYDGDLSLRAKCGSKVSNELTVGMAPFVIEADDLNVFATGAYVTVVGAQGYEAPALNDIAFIAKKDGESSYSAVSHTMEDNGYAHITGLEPNSDYLLKVRIDGIGSKATAIHTEAATQLENGNLDDWSYQQGNSNNHWGIYTLSGWDTMNLLTTSEGGSYDTNYLGQTTDNGGAGYRAKSGTIETEESVSGKAALIQTVGWGKANGLDYSGRAGLLGTQRVEYPLRCDNTTPGELYLGEYNKDTTEPDYGITFSSRPAALSFMYKYIPKNEADWGIAEIHVIDQNGAVIAEKQVTLAKADEYTSLNIELEYGLGMKKAAKLQVTFKSTGNESCLPFNDDNFDYPSNKPLTTAEGFIGSKLYVDDIQLIY